MNQPFEWVMEKSVAKTRPSEQTMLPVEADLLLGPDSSSEMDSETNDQSYSPTKVYALTWHGYTAHIMHTCLALHSLDIIYTIFNTMFLVQISYMRMPSA